MLQDVREYRKINWFKFTSINAWVKRPLRTIKDTGKNISNCQVAGSWGSKGTAREAWPYDTLLSSSVTEKMMGLWTVYTVYFSLSITPHGS